MKMSYMILQDKLHFQYIILNLNKIIETCVLYEVNDKIISSLNYYKHQGTNYKMGKVVGLEKISTLTIIVN